MVKVKKILLLSTVLLQFLCCPDSFAQDTSGLERDVEFLSGEFCAGRRSGTAGAVEAASFIARRFRKHHLRPASPGYSMSFVLENGKVGRNIVGFQPGWGDKYVIVAAHYDNLGILEGNIYPGADSNASGVAMMLGLIPELALTDHPQTVIYVAMDAHQSMEGARDLLRRIEEGRLVNPTNGMPVSLKSITMFVNLDMLGSTLSPVHAGRPDYMIMLGAEKNRDLLRRLNLDGLDLSFDYYGSAGFTDMFLNRVGEQRVFKEAGVPVALFTSGITMLTNRREDIASSLDYPVMAKRFILLYHFLDHAIPIL